VCTQSDVCCFSNLHSLLQMHSEPNGTRTCVATCCVATCVGTYADGANVNLKSLLAKPQSWGAAPRFGVFPPKFPPGRAGPPSPPPAPKTCTVTQTYKSGSPAVSGRGEGRWRCCWAHRENENYSHQCVQARPAHPPTPKLAQ